MAEVRRYDIYQRFPPEPSDHGAWVTAADHIAKLNEYVNGVAEARSEEKVALAVAQDDLEAERERSRKYREALRFYDRQYGVGSVLASDGGKVARQALTEAGEGEDATT